MEELICLKPLKSCEVRQNLLFDLTSFIAALFGFCGVDFFFFLLIHLPEASLGLSKFLLQCLVGLLFPARGAVRTLSNF